MSFELRKILFKNLIFKIKNKFDDCELYDIHSNEFALVYKDDDSIISKVNSLAEKKFTSVRVDKYVLSLVIKVGVYKVDKADNNVINFYNKARATADQGEFNESGAYFYNSELFYNNKINFEIASTLLDSLYNQEFYLVYQPIICLKDNSIVGSEVLTRWDRGDLPPVGPQLFIEIAENIGCISEFSNWIFSEAIKQLVKWREKNIVLRTSVNITAKELIDENLIQITKEKIDLHEIDRSLISIEITERVISDKLDGLKEALEKFRLKDYKISIDDFGTGYNSLKFIGEIPFDTLKIDKYFIDRLNEFELSSLVSNIINAAHAMGKNVVAEGVETEYQAEMLKSMGCDLAQGYLFSKPLLPDDFEKYYFDKMV